MVMGKQDLILVETREAQMVNLVGDGEPSRRRGHFLKPVGRFAHQTALVASPSRPLAASPRVAFKGWHCPIRRWTAWVQEMERLHGEEWDAAGIRGAIKASTCKVVRRPELIWELAARYWCPRTNTFVFSWGEATPTLEDMAILGGLPLLGQPAMTMAPLTGDLAEMHERMLREMRKFNYRASKKASHADWLKHYMDEQGAGGDKVLEHVAFLSLWLSRCVFPGPPDNTVGQHVLPVAIRLAKSFRVSLAPAVLAVLYRDLRVLNRHASAVVQADGENADVVLWAPFQLLQMWVLERFPSLWPNAAPRQLQPHQPRAARWHESGAPSAIWASAKAVFESPHQFLWRPYVVDVVGWLRPCFYSDAGRWVDASSSSGNEELLSFSRCLAPSELVSLDCVEQYLPHRVSMQLGFDQDIPAVVRRANSSRELGWSTYDQPLDRVRFYLPSRSSRPQATSQFRRWWGIHSSNRSLEKQVPTSSTGIQETPPEKVLVEMEVEQGSGSMMHVQNSAVKITLAGTAMEEDLGGILPTEDVPEFEPEEAARTANMEALEGLGRAAPSRSLGFKASHGTRKRKTLAELLDSAVPSPVQQRPISCPVTREISSPKSIPSNAEQSDYVMMVEGPVLCPDSRVDVRGCHDPSQHTKVAGEEEQTPSPGSTTSEARIVQKQEEINAEHMTIYTQASVTVPGPSRGDAISRDARASLTPGASRCNPITIDDMAETPPNKVEEGEGGVVLELISHLDRLAQEVSLLRSKLMGLPQRRV